MRFWATVFLILLPFLAFAQEEEDDKSRIAKFLESSLSGAGREVTIEGFKGALSSTVTMESLSISDDQGVWLSLSGATLEWNRSAILAGRIEVNRLSAQEIYLPRLPKTEPAPAKAETTPFALPELPVSIDIGELAAGSLFLGEDIIGTDATFSINGALKLIDGDGSANMRIARLDGPTGHFDLEAGFANATRNLKIDLLAREDAGGIVATLAKLPDTPSLEFAIKGEGPLEEYVARIHLKSDGEERLRGLVALNVVADPNLPTPAPGEPLIDPMRVFSVDLQGDITPLFIPEYQSFFGDNVSITTVIRSFADGRTRLDQLLLETAHLQVRGDMELLPTGLPERFALDINLSSQDGTPVLLPLPDQQVFVGEAKLEAGFNQAAGDAWRLRGRVSDFRQDALTFASADIIGGGEILLGESPSVTADIGADVLGIKTTDEGLREALGDRLSFDAALSWAKGSPLEIHQLDLAAQGMKLDAEATVRRLDSEISITTRVIAGLDELSGFSKLAGRPLGGAASANLSGDILPLSGKFDVTLAATATDLEIGDPRVDALARGESKLLVSAARDETGIDLRNLSLVSPNLNAKAAGRLDSNKGALDFEAGLSDLAAILPDVPGPVTLEGQVTQDQGNTRARVTATAPGDINVDGTYEDLADSAVSIVLEGAIGNIARYVASVPGSAEFKAQVSEEDTDWKVAAQLQGSIGSKVDLSGTIAQDFANADLSAQGRLPLALANIVLRPNSLQGDASFDLALKGKPAPENLSGTISTNGAQFVLPALQYALSDINTRIGIERQSASIELRSAGSAGGGITVNGTVDLAPPFASNINVALNSLGFQKGSLLKTSANGNLAITGPLTSGPALSGDIGLGATDVRISPGALGGSSSVPEIVHRNETSRIHQTRSHAGLIKEEGAGNGSSSSPIALDISLRTDERIIVRGLGLYAEFDGALDVVGNSNDVLTDGEFDLARGRLDLLGKRFELSEGLIRLAGSFDPDIRIIAETRSGDTHFEIVVFGSASSPELEINSDPQLPEDEMLSHLLFGKGISNISPIQAAQLASAAATLSGGGQGAIRRVNRITGLDELGITTGEDGSAGLRAGKYINENIYTDIGINARGQSTINLNLDITDNLTVKGQVDSDSDTGIGIFYRHDY